MSISKFNHEGYYDPTPYGAFKSIEKEEKRKARFRPIVYICAPHSDIDQSSIEYTQRYCRFAVDRGYLPIAPQLYFPQFMDDIDEYLVAEGFDPISKRYKLVS